MRTRALATKRRPALLFQPAAAAAAAVVRDRVACRCVGGTEPGAPIGAAAPAMRKIRPSARTHTTIAVLIGRRDETGTGETNTA